MNLYRYFSEEKFFDLLSSSELYFSSVANNENQDNPEGDIPEIDMLLADGTAQMLDFALDLWPSADGSPSKYTETEKNKIEQDIITGTYKLFGVEYNRNEVPVEKALEEYKKHVYISCWTKSLTEEEHMWRNYGKNKCGFWNSVRVKTSEKRFLNSDNNRNTHVMG